MRNLFPKRPSGAPLHTLSKLYDVPVGFVTPPYCVAEYCFYGRRRVAVARYRMICLVFANTYNKLSCFGYKMCHSKMKCEKVILDNYEEYYMC